MFSPKSRIFFPWRAYRPEHKTSKENETKMQECLKLTNKELIAQLPSQTLVGCPSHTPCSYPGAGPALGPGNWLTRQQRFYRVNLCHHLFLSSRPLQRPERLGSAFLLQDVLKAAILRLSLVQWNAKVLWQGKRCSCRILACNYFSIAAFWWTQLGRQGKFSQAEPCPENGFLKEGSWGYNLLRCCRKTITSISVQFFEMRQRSGESGIHEAANFVRSEVPEWKLRGERDGVWKDRN